MPHRHPILTFALLLTLAGCQVPPRTSSGDASTIATNPEAPQRVLTEIYGASWQNIGDLRYDAFMKFEGWIAADGHIHHPRLKSATPDRKRVSLALNLIRNVALPSSGRVDSHIRPRAEIQVYFYESEQATPEAFIVAWRTQSVGFTDSDGRDAYATFVKY